MKVERRPLRELCSLHSGATPSKGKPNLWIGSLPWFSPKDLKCFDLWDSVDHISEPPNGEKAGHVFQPGSVLVVARSGVLKHSLPVGVLRRTAAFNQDIRALVPKAELLDSDYLGLFLRSREKLVVHEGVKEGATVQSLKAGYLEEMLVPTPGLDSQRKIAAATKDRLHAADHMLAAALKKLDDIRKLRQVALSDVFREQTDKRPIGLVAKVQSGFAFQSMDFAPNGIRLLRNVNVAPGQVRWADTACIPENKATGLNRFSLRIGDIILSLDRPMVAAGLKVARLTEEDLPALLVQRVGRFVLNESLVDPNYLYAWMQTSQFSRALQGHEQSLGVPHVSPSQVEAIELPLPSVKEQQRLGALAAAVLTAGELAVDAATKIVADMNLLPSSLLAEAFA